VNIRYLIQYKPTKLAQAVTLLTCIWEVLSSNLSRDTNHPELHRDTQFLKQILGQYPTLGHD